MLFDIIPVFNFFLSSQDLVLFVYGKSYRIKVLKSRVPVGEGGTQMSGVFMIQRTAIKAQ